jgi:alpha-beta hydrolase superfamily lysophospholipase
MLPGLDGSGKLFRPLLQVLPFHLKAQVIPYPADRVLSYDALVPFVRRAFPRGEPFVLLGESFGGPLCLKCVFPSVENLRAVILSATFVTNPLPTSFSWIPWIPQWLTAWTLQLSLLMLWSAFTLRAWIRLRIYSSCCNKQKW